MLPVVVIPLVTDTTIPKHPLLDVAIESAGYLLMMAGVGLRLWSTLYIGARKSRELIRHGPYSMCRNPLYLGTCAIVAGVAILFTNPIMLLAALLLFVPATLLTIKMEETHLEGIFGEEYRDYRRQVPRFWPSLRRYAGLDMLEVPSRIIARAAIETSGVLLVPLAEDVIQVLHSINWLPALWTLRF
jgi:protein-S-isoprenylcysteine O-methyltransferase Ste14